MNGKSFSFFFDQTKELLGKSQRSCSDLKISDLKSEIFGLVPVFATEFLIQSDASLHRVQLVGFGKIEFY